MDESVSVEVGQKIYERAFGRGCGTCHDLPSNPQLPANIKAGLLDRARFEKVVREGKG
ncbi:MAG: cytochrome c, partial [Methylococcales bacterium]